jgi:hypothetical protein
MRFCAAAALVGLLIVPTLGACASSERAPAPALVQPAELASGDAVPGPVDEIALSISDSPAEADAEPVDLDLATIGRLAQYELEVYEPFVERRVTFTGVRPRDLLALVAPGAQPGKVELLALDDYETILDGALLLSDDLLLATHADGRQIPVEEGGPIRLVFADGAPDAANTDLWIWSVRWMTLR